MTLNGIIGKALAALNNGGPASAFAYAFAVGLGFGCGLLMSAAVFNLLPNPLNP